MAFHRVGITFAVYGEEAGQERLIPFDIVPRIIPGRGVARMEAGLRQRVKALNAFLHDIYHDQEILKAGRIPAAQVLGNSQYRKEMVGVTCPGRPTPTSPASTWCAPGRQGRVLRAGGQPAHPVRRVLHAGRPQDDDAALPRTLRPQSIAPVEHYPDLLLHNLRSVAQAGVNNPNVVLLTPGQFNSAYFEHAFLAQQMGIELVEGNDLFVRDDGLHAHHAGPAAGGRDLPPHRRRLPRSAGLPQGFGARRARPVQRLPRRP
jgi:uncharacterized circularly permuted ATP-grasp superfamily protein